VQANDTEEHRRANRRIEIVLLPKLNELPDLSVLEQERAAPPPSAQDPTPAATEATPGAAPVPTAPAPAPTPAVDDPYAPAPDALPPAEPGQPIPL
jgi:hypothetical protein